MENIGYLVAAYAVIWADEVPCPFTAISFEVVAFATRSLWFSLHHHAFLLCFLFLSRAHFIGS